VTRIRTSSHSLKFANTNKADLVEAAVREWRRVGGLIIDEVWRDGYLWEQDGSIKVFNVHKNLLSVPGFMDYNRFRIDTFLTARALSSLVTQICGVLKASVEKQRKRLFVLEDFKGQTRKKKKLLVRKIKTNIP
jgi:hypothetical protein